MSMVENIEICGGPSCQTKGSELLKDRLGRIVDGLDYEIAKKDCTGHCSIGPTVRIGDDIYSGTAGIFLESDDQLREFLKTYESVTKIEGNCQEARGRDCGLAVDIGTTMIKASLVDLANETVLGEISTTNKQRAYGTTVLHRWNYFNKAKNRKANLKNLSEIVQKSVGDVKAFFAEKSGTDISQVVLAGNTTMTYLFLNEDPRLTFDDKPDYISTKYQDGKVLLPCIFEWVGGDIVSGMTYLGFDKFDKNVMLIDLGTNGEVALSTKDKIILVASASAGPAFEGEGFKNGMPYMQGAIHEVSSNGKELQFRVVGQKEPLGICGSGMLDLIAEMSVGGIMDKGGRLSMGAKEFFLTGNISVSQEEIEYFKNSKAAIFATIRTVLQESGLSEGDLDVIYVAGGFGNMNLDKAQAIGLLPSSDKYKFVGNTSLKGVQSCLKPENLARAEIIARSSTPLSLADSNAWMEHYQASRFFSPQA